MSARPLRLVVAGALGVALLTAGGSVASPPLILSCNLMTDPKGDASFLDTVPNDASLDIVSADVATDAKTLTAVLRVDALSAVSPTSPLGRGYYVLFNAPKAEFPLYFNVQITPDLTEYEWGTLETLPSGNGSYEEKGVATGVVDAAKNELRISVPLKDIGVVAKLARGTKLSNLAASTTSLIGTSQTPSLVATVDEASSSKPYFVGAPSCVRPGK